MGVGSTQALNVTTTGDGPRRLREAETARDVQPPLAVLLREGFRWFMERLNDESTSVGDSRISGAAAVVVSHLRPDGSRPADLARAMGVTRQHVHTVIRELIDAGVVDSIPDPTSRRDRLVIPTPDGEARRRRAVSRLAALETELGQQIGPADLEILRDILTRLWSPTGRGPAA